jgi:MinD-like ATPase involved in chromosome partitioning or flagellar assembly
MILSIVSSKRNVGKTSLALNMAAMLQTLGHNVAVVDMDFETAGASSSIGAKDMPVKLTDVLSQDSHIKEASYIHPSGMRIVANRPTKYFSHHAIEMKVKSLNEEVVILDTDSRKGLLSALHLATELIAVTTPDKESVNHAMKTLRFGEECGGTVLGVVINRADRKLNLETAERALMRAVLGIVTEHDAYMEINPVSYLYPQGTAARQYRRIAQEIVQRRLQ